jgi:FliI/YscN family ATPase
MNEQQVQLLDLAAHQQVLADVQPVVAQGRVKRLVGTTVVATGPATAVGALCHIAGPDGPIEALVTGFIEEGILLQPYDAPSGIRPGAVVNAVADRVAIPVGPDLLGRVVDARGRPLDDGARIGGRAQRALNGPPPAALARPPIDDVLATGSKVVDTLLTVGRGQRLGIFAGPGVGKSTLLADLARATACDVVVLGLIGERGREVGEFIHRVLGPEGLSRSVIVVATSDRPAVERRQAAETAHTIAEHLRDTGLDVLLLVDSLTRYCHAGRDIGLANGEAPAIRGYPASALAPLAPLLERSGPAAVGSITAFYTVLVSGDDPFEPVADQVRGILDGHIVLDRRLAERGHFPAIDVGASLSRLANELWQPEQQQLAQMARTVWSEYHRVRELIEVGAYQEGADPQVDAAVAAFPAVRDFVQQAVATPVPTDQAWQELAQALQGFMMTGAGHGS